MSAGDGKAGRWRQLAERWRRGRQRGPQRQGRCIAAIGALFSCFCTLQWCHSREPREARGLDPPLARSFARW